MYFYGVTSDYLLGLTENREQHRFPVDDLGLDDETVELLKSGKLNVRLICEMIKHPEFINFLSDMEIYVDNLAGMQFRNTNKMIEQTRVHLQNKGMPISFSKISFASSKCAAIYSGVWASEPRVIYLPPKSLYSLRISLDGCVSDKP